MAIINRFITLNVAPKDAAAIGVEKDGSIVGKINLGALQHSYGTKRYSFGALSDLHNTRYSDWADNYVLPRKDLTNALTYLGNKGAAFACACGDLSVDGRSWELDYIEDSASKANWTVKQNAASGKKLLYSCLGNHEMLDTYWNHTTGIFPDADNPTDEYYWGSRGTNWISFIGRTDVTGANLTDKHQMFTYNNDVFILFSLNSAVVDSNRKYTNVYSLDDMKWLYEKLMANRNKRCFVFTHLFMKDKSGNYADLYTNKMDANSEAWFDKLFQKFKNVIWFSGHSHWDWECQGSSNGNISDKGNNWDANIYPANTLTRTTGWAVHLPSCAYPRIPVWSSTENKYVEGSDYFDSQFALIDVYDNGIAINGITQLGKTKDEVTADNLVLMPIGTYYLKTNIITVDDTPISDFASGSTDSGSTDSGSTDSGSTDSGSTASGSTDSGSTDSGSTDSGSTDSGGTTEEDGSEVAEKDWTDGDLSVNYLSDKGVSSNVYSSEYETEWEDVSRGLVKGRAYLVFNGKIATTVTTGKWYGIIMQQWRLDDNVWRTKIPDNIWAPTAETGAGYTLNGQYSYCGVKFNSIGTHEIDISYSTSDWTVHVTLTVKVI